jgi:glutathione synthase/RimK-type ligase-like ATP-grasp enzyme
MPTRAAPIVIVGSLADDHCRAVHEGLRARGHEPYVLDAQRFPDELPISLGHALDDIVIDGRPMGRPASAYVRSLYQHPAGYGVEADEAMKEDWRRTLLAFRERATLLSAVLLRWERLGVPLYNPSAANLNITKPYQLALLQAHELPVPATLWSNDPQAVRAFCGAHQAIYKPVAGGAATRRVEARDLEPERLARLEAAPVCFQELLPGDDVRVYVIDGRIVCALRIESEAIDFRQHETSIEPVELPAEVLAQCIRATEVVGLRYTGMDLKRDRHGAYKILELNPSAMFLGFEARAGVEIGGPLCDALCAHARPAPAERAPLA